MALTTNYVITFLERKNLDQDYYQFDFVKPEGFEFEEGQFGVFGFNDREIEGRRLRAFSIASTNDEAFIRLGTKIVAEPSDFKKNMMSLKPGDVMTMNAPKGEFVFEKNMKAIFIAGGIGITPIRSMLLCKERSVSGRNDLLLYSELLSSYPFRDELEKLPGLTIKYAADIAPTQKLVIDAANENQEDSMFYLSGSPGFVNGIKALLEQQGIKPECIRHDVFTGY